MVPYCVFKYILHYEKQWQLFHIFIFSNVND